MTNILLVAIFIISFSQIGTNSQEFSKALSRNVLGVKREKLSHLHFYWHEIMGGKNDTAYHITQPVAPSFGSATVMDDPLTEGPELGSKLVGRCQGMYASTSQSTISYLVSTNFIFDQGEFNGSSVSVIGRDSVLREVREMPIVGGSGRFRFARGYAEARTYIRNITAGVLHAIVEYDMYVLHYY